MINPTTRYHQGSGDIPEKETEKKKTCKSWIMGKDYCEKLSSACDTGITATVRDGTDGPQDSPHTEELLVVDNCWG